MIFVPVVCIYTTVPIWQDHTSDMILTNRAKHDLENIDKYKLHSINNDGCKFKMNMNSKWNKWMNEWMKQNKWMKQTWMIHNEWNEWMNETNKWMKQINEWMSSRANVERTNEWMKRMNEWRNWHCSFAHIVHLHTRHYYTCIMMYAFYSKMKWMNHILKWN